MKSYMIMNTLWVDFAFDDLMIPQIDRAFLYFVWDYFTGSILFMGRVTRPLVL